MTAPPRLTMRSAARVVLTGCGLATVIAGGAAAATVTVTVERVPNDRGEVHVDLCDAATFLTTNCPYDASRPARRGTIVVVVPNVAPGRYAAVAYHDANANHDLDLNALGIPTELYGFSNNPPMLLGPPLFKDSAFDVADKDVAVKIRLRR
jgi:uncharacterized protein (DUF2141 family)